MVSRHTDPLTIGQLAERSGLAASALRFYEQLDLIRASRTPGGARRYPRSTLRRVAFIRAAQAVGLSLADIGAALQSLPGERTPTRSDWARLSRQFRALLDARIRDLERLRDGLTDCIGCGCLSLQRCQLYNRNDELAAQGAGAHRLQVPRLADTSQSPA
ncbi:MAG: redox-sensitive transcriptional activator SoxR [Mycobacteriales bacterium]